MQKKNHSICLGGQTLNFSTGELAKQAAGAVWVTCGGTAVLITAQGAKEPRVGVDFVPLTVDYQEKMSAAGKIPGGFFKREGKPRDEETLISRLIDRSLRPLFVEGWSCETQVIATVFSSDPDHPADTLALTGASLALMISDIPFAGPIVGIRVCRVDGQLLVNPSFDQRDAADINLFVSCSESSIVMVEGGALEIPEAEVLEALLFAHSQAQVLIGMQKEFAEALKPSKRSVDVAPTNPQLGEVVEQFAKAHLPQAYALQDKTSRYRALDANKKELWELVKNSLGCEEVPAETNGLWEQAKYNWVRNLIVTSQKRIDGRGLTDIRPINCQIGLLPRTHGSALFTRGETQALVSVTLGTRQDEQKVDDLLGERYRSFMLHYNFPPYSVGETKFLRGPGRREIGHGALAERALSALIETSEDFPYVIRVMSDILESNGSSSMATVCGGSLALMDAGVPIRRACAGIAMGLIIQDGKVAILSDILGDEDHLGDMDFKVARSEKGITAIQMDIKIAGIDADLFAKALAQAEQGCRHILSCMQYVIAEPKAHLSDYAPRITRFKIRPDRIRDVIGPGGKIIKSIVANTGCQISVEDDGWVQVSSNDGEAARRAIKMIQDITQEAEIGKIYVGTVRTITKFGAFVNIFPGTDGLVPLSELAVKAPRKVEDVVEVGDEVLVKVIGLEKGKVRLSRKDALPGAANHNAVPDNAPLPLQFEDNAFDGSPN